MSDKDLAKIKLIYEFNNNSPLFARVAESLVNEGNYDEAVSILHKGLEKYPDYLTAKLGLIEALAKKGEYKEVINKMDEIRSDLDNETVNYYLDKIEEEREKKSELMSSIRGESSNIEEDLEGLAEKISKAKMPPPEESHTKPDNTKFTPKGNQFVSETLAEIYFNQGNYQEALDMYEKLLESNPKKSEQFKKKIEEIKNSMK